MDSPQNIVSFCTGYGGLELGLRRAGVDVRTVCYNEIEAFAQANLVAKIEEGRMDNAPIWTDLKTFPAQEFCGVVDGITCGYPCQPFSSAGKRKGKEDPRHLWPYIREHVQTIGPSWVWAENVEGHISLGLPTVLSDLEEDGFQTAWGIFSAEEVGAPHRRKRVFILGHSASIRSCGGSENRKGKQPKVLGAGLESYELAHSKGDDVKGCDLRQRKIELGRSGCGLKWPARPNEEQYEWEEPRVIETQPCVGLSANAASARVDELRLLGNGVVPQTAELAWKTLWRELNEG